MKLSTTNAQRLINQFEQAVRQHEQMGAFPPEDYDLIEKEYKKQKKKLFQFFTDCIIQ